MNLRDDGKSNIDNDTADRVAPQVRQGNPVNSWNGQGGARTAMSRIVQMAMSMTSAIAPQMIWIEELGRYFSICIVNADPLAGY